MPAPVLAIFFTCGSTPVGNVMDLSLKHDDKTL
jgi:hypothetical protein